MPPDVRVRRVVVSVLLLFALAVVFQIHGSAVGFWKHALADAEAPSGLLFSNPKQVRTDEWMAWTPSLLAQAAHDPPFPIENPNIGAGKTPLLVNLPARHYSMVFRPQLWGFFVFDVETAYAFYWSVKAFGLFLAFFFLFRVLTAGQFWLSLFGSAWVCLSAYIQWWFSCPPMLPEMLACWAVAIVCVINLFRTQKLLSTIATVLVLMRGRRELHALLLPAVSDSADVSRHCSAGRLVLAEQSSRLVLRRGGVALGCALLGLVAVITPYIIECKPTLEIVAATKYPGERRSLGGDLQVQDAFNGVLGFFNSSEGDYLATRGGNPCEASNFYPLWGLVLAGSGFALWRERKERRLETLVLGFLPVITLYIFCPFPQWFCRIALLNYVTGTRTLLAGILLTVLVLARPFEMRMRRERVMLALGSFALIALVLAASYPGNEKFLTDSRCALLLGLNALLVGLYFFAPLRVFCSVFIACLLLNNGGVNPIATGLGPLLRASPASVVDELHKRDPTATWAVYSHNAHAQFLKTRGIEVLNGLKYVPDVEFCSALDPSGKQEGAYNRYGFLSLVMSKGNREFADVGPAVYRLDVSPRDPVLLARGVRYLLVEQPMQFNKEDGIELIAARPQNRMWFYRIASAM